jgi:hypothetical protein
MEETYYSNEEMYSSCYIKLLEMPTHALEEVIIKTSKIHNLFMQYNNTCFNALKSS